MDRISGNSLNCGVILVRRARTLESLMISSCLLIPVFV